MSEQLAIPEEARYSNAPTEELRELAWTARALVNAVTVPDGIRGKPGDILAVMLAGRELGIGPMAATRMVHIINGQTSVATELKLALGLKAGHDIKAAGEGAGWCVVGCESHPEAPTIGWALNRESEPPQFPLVNWTIADQIMQGSKRLVDKDNWRNYQRDMLFWRAASQFMRRHCPGLAGGLYTLEELNGEAENAEDS